MKALLPALNSPTTTSRKSSSSCCDRPGEGGQILAGRITLGEQVADVSEESPLVGEQPPLLLVENLIQCHGRHITTPT